MIVLIIVTLVTVFAQCVVARLLTEQVWAKSQPIWAAAAVQFFGIGFLMMFVSSVFQGVATVLLLVLGGLFFEGEHPFVSGFPASPGTQVYGVIFGAVMLLPFVYLLVRVIKLGRKARATARWQGGKT